MPRTRNDQPTLWESLLPPALLRLPEVLARVDALLGDEAFFAPLVGHVRDGTGYSANGS
jgi:IS5 family transposase